MGEGKDKGAPSPAEHELVITRVFDAPRTLVFDCWTSTVADFAVASALPYAHAAKLPLAQYPAIQRWYARLEDLPAWRDPIPA